MDGALNSICLTLQWPFFHDIYFKMCNLCHKRVKSCVLNTKETSSNVESGSPTSINDKHTLGDAYT